MGTSDLQQTVYMWVREQRSAGAFNDNSIWHNDHNLRVAVANAMCKAGHRRPFPYNQQCLDIAVKSLQWMNS